MDGTEEGNEESYKTTDEMSQNDMPTYEKIETSDGGKSSLSEEDDNHDGHKEAEEYDEHKMSMTGETERKGEEEKEGKWIQERQKRTRKAVFEFDSDSDMEIDQEQENNNNNNNNNNRRNNKIRNVGREENQILTSILRGKQDYY